MTDVLIYEQLTATGCDDRKLFAEGAAIAAACVRAFENDRTRVAVAANVDDATLPPILRSRRIATEDIIGSDFERTLPIAPDEGLAEVVEQLSAAGHSCWSCDSNAIRQCADKVVTAERLRTVGVAVPETLATSGIAPIGSVVKPRFGCGSEGVIRVRPRPQPVKEGCFCQTYVSGRHGSVFAIRGEVRTQLFPVVWKELSFKTTPVEGASVVGSRIQALDQLVQTCVELIPGLRGPFGIDFVLTDYGTPVVIEINPRVTSSLVGYVRASSTPVFATDCEPDWRTDYKRFTWRDAYDWSDR